LQPRTWVCNLEKSLLTVNGIRSNSAVVLILLNTLLLQTVNRTEGRHINPVAGLSVMTF